MGDDRKGQEEGKGMGVYIRKGNEKVVNWILEIGKWELTDFIITRQ